jgi:hypothetical protein
METVTLVLNIETVTLVLNMDPAVSRMQLFSHLRGMLYLMIQRDRNPTELKRLSRVTATTRTSSQASLAAHSCFPDRSQCSPTSLRIDNI